MIVFPKNFGIITVIFVEEKFVGRFIVCQSIFLVISCPVASVLYSEGKEEGRRKGEEGLKA
ncbi:hypothetical protein [Okeania sp. SIO2B3]|uniref:hypothetical protein n=1 Tax=Okeania sp. SIO2B3 TaxID=2607784 RepID=UPI0013C10D33|nr:hypothetical protein [Okeania sp. SIO2B3]NET46312.1 hypothetical protein [Okeania sp. SIO2B3]